MVVTKDAEAVESDVHTATQSVAVPAGTSVTVTGASIFETAAFELMLLDALALFAGGFLVVFVVVFLVMRRRLDDGRQAFFSLAVAFASVVVMLGGMGALGFDFNAIMLAVLPVGVGLSVDYALQIHTRYVDERDSGAPPVDAAGVAARTTGRALVLAMGTTVVGFGSLLASPVPPVRQFGVTASINVAAAMVLSVTLLVALLVEADVRSGARLEHRERSTGLLERVVGRFSRVAGARPGLVVLLVLPAVAGGAVAYPHVDTTQELLDYWPQDIAERTQFEEAVETAPSPKTVYVLVETAQAYQPGTVRDVDRFQERVADLPGVNGVGGPVTTLKAATGGSIPDDPTDIDRTLDRATDGPLTAATAPDRHPQQLLLTLYVDDLEGAEIRSLVDRLDALAATELPADRVVVTGKPVVTRSVIENVTAGLERTTALSFAAAFGFLLVALRSPRDSLLLLATVPATAALLVLGAMYLLEIPWNPGTVSMASIALGVGVDYGLHVHERYSELRDEGVAPAAAMDRSLQALSRPVVGSGLTTIAGFGVLVFSQFPVVRNFGKTLVLVVAISMLAAFVVFPAATLALDGRPSRRPLRRVLPVIGEGPVASSGTVTYAEAGDAAPSPVPGAVRDDERVQAVVGTDGGELTVDGSNGTHRVRGGDGRSYAIVTDDRLVFAIEPADPAEATLEAVDYHDVWAVDADAGRRTTTLTVKTHDDATYRFVAGGHLDLQPLVAHVTDRVDTWADLTAHLDRAASSLATLRSHVADEGMESAETVAAVRESLDAARSVAEPALPADDPVHNRIASLESSLAETQFQHCYAGAESRRSEAEERREDDRFAAAAAAYEAALRAYGDALELTSEAPVGDADQLNTRRERVSERLETLYEAPERRARQARERAADTADASAAVDAWETALEYSRDALELAWGESPFAGDVDELRETVEEVAGRCIETRRDRALELEETADAMVGGAALRRDLYADAEAHLDRARTLAAELRAGDPSALASARDRVATKRDSLEDGSAGEDAVTG
jgi:hydrophobe/amphiphile efflux-3 (HAE3) family protein